VQGQVLLAELITEAVCREIARSGVERGRFLAPMAQKLTRSTTILFVCRISTRI